MSGAIPEGMTRLHFHSVHGQNFAVDCQNDKTIEELQAEIKQAACHALGLEDEEGDRVLRLVAAGVGLLTENPSRTVNDLTSVGFGHEFDTILAVLTPANG